AVLVVVVLAQQRVTLRPGAAAQRVRGFHRPTHATATTAASEAVVGGSFPTSRAVGDHDGGLPRSRPTAERPPEPRRHGACSKIRPKGGGAMDVRVRVLGEFGVEGVE